MWALKRDKLRSPLLQLVLRPQLVCTAFLLFLPDSPHPQPAPLLILAVYLMARPRVSPFWGLHLWLPCLSQARVEPYLEGNPSCLLAFWHEEPNVPYFVVTRTLALLPGPGIRPGESWKSKAAGPRVSGSVTTGFPNSSSGADTPVALFPRFLHSTYQGYKGIGRPLI